jgi:hypothetical protein
MGIRRTKGREIRRPAEEVAGSPFGPRGVRLLGGDDPRLGSCPNSHLAYHGSGCRGFTQ